MKQEGRTEAELTESYCFLYPDKSKVPARERLCHGGMRRDEDSELCASCCVQLQWVCEKGLSVGHSRITTLGNPSAGECAPPSHPSDPPARPKWHPHLIDMTCDPLSVKSLLTPHLF